MARKIKEHEEKHGDETTGSAAPSPGSSSGSSEPSLPRKGKPGVATRKKKTEPGVFVHSDEDEKLPQAVPARKRPGKKLAARDDGSVSAETTSPVETSTKAKSARTARKAAPGIKSDVPHDAETVDGTASTSASIPDKPKNVRKSVRKTPTKKHADEDASAPVPVHKDSSPVTSSKTEKERTDGVSKASAGSEDKTMEKRRKKVASEATAEADLKAPVKRSIRKKTEDAAPPLLSVIERSDEKDVKKKTTVRKRKVSSGESDAADVVETAETVKTTRKKTASSGRVREREARENIDESEVCERPTDKGANETKPDVVAVSDAKPDAPKKKRTGKKSVGKKKGKPSPEVSPSKSLRDGWVDFVFPKLFSTKRRLPRPRVSEEIDGTLVLDWSSYVGHVLFLKANPESGKAFFRCTALVPGKFLERCEESDFTLSDEKERVEVAGVLERELAAFSQSKFSRKKKKRKR